MKYKCTRCGDVVEFNEYKDQPLKQNKDKLGQMIMVAGVVGLCLGVLLCVAISDYNGSECISNETLMNQTNLSFQYGAMQGIEYAINEIGSEATQCKQVPMMFQNQSYNIVAVECLELNQGGNK